MPQYTTITQRATHTESTGANWNNVSRAYDGDENSYAERLVSTNSACHINGYSFDLPSNATVDKVVVEFKAYTLSSYGYFAGYLYTDTGSSIAYSIFLDGKAHTTPSYFSLEVPASKIQEKLNSLNVYDKNILTYLKSGVRVRWVGGSTSSWIATTCRVYDTKVTVYYTVPEKHTVTVTAGTGGTVTGGGTYDYGAQVTLTATPSTGYHFVRWSDGNTSQTRTLTVTSNVSLTAYFEADKINKIFSGSTNTNVYIGSTEADSVNVGNTKIYG